MNTPAQTPALTDGLLPCPFCGEQPVSLAITEDDSFVRCYAIRCDHCKIEFSEEYKSQTIDQWNTRALAPTRPPAVRDALFRTVDSVVVAEIARIFTPHNRNLAQSYSEQIVRILEPGLSRALQAREAESGTVETFSEKDKK